MPAQELGLTARQPKRLCAGAVRFFAANIAFRIARLTGIERLRSKPRPAPIPQRQGFWRQVRRHCKSPVVAAGRNSERRRGG
jgi:hypothetical protein